MTQLATDIAAEVMVQRNPQTLELYEKYLTVLPVKSLPIRVILRKLSTTAEGLEPDAKNISMFYLQKAYR